MCFILIAIQFMTKIYLFVILYSLYHKKSKIVNFVCFFSQKIIVYTMIMDKINTFGLFNNL